MSSNKNFFARKRIWSEVKDDLLRCYLKPYAVKVLMTNHPILYVDCFAGKGKFEDGSLGSPLIAMETFREVLTTTYAKNPKIESRFIEAKFSTELENNLSKYIGWKVISGRYENEISGLLQYYKSYNIFLYIDPYGVKSLKFNFFDEFSKSGFNSTEILLNLNTFGFLRVACKVVKASNQIMQKIDEIIGNDLIEFESTNLTTSEQSKLILNDIAGGNYWEDIINDFISGKISFYEAEQRFGDIYCNQLKQRFRYVLNMPIRITKGQSPKYRMIYVTNHADGCNLMYENMCKRWEALKDLQSNGQFDFIQTSVEEKYVEPEIIKGKFLNHLLSYEEETRLNVVMADFYSENGILCKKDEFTHYLKEFEKNHQISLRREPRFTPTKKMSKFLNETPKNHIYVKKP